ncbi:Protein of unknown function [Gillisia sp. Hel1_33_143]|uniref:DUF3891 family protein n=1 Tax=Gillisia sp. Hel1_33_143 TaxID=1336796 RepID=UPI00087DE466|nr:DUF3891 family protein [Gillisia sp. Hel1_33_143]SDS74705.1 Protein of unknown function [Gillisia sp. Hel1_33_143]
MIVNSTNKGWEIFSHSAHGLLAGNIAFHLAKKFQHLNWVATLTAIIEHDDRQLHFEEKNYLTEIGTPQDFLNEERKPMEIIKRSKRLLFEAEKKSTWVAILIIHHLQYIYSDDASKNKSLSNFLNKLGTVKKNYMKPYNLKSEDIINIYQIMIFADRCSLILCQHAIPTKKRKLEINKSIENKTYFIWNNDPNEVIVEPWIFDDTNFKLSCEYKLLDQSAFTNNKEFEDVLHKTPVKIKNWRFVKGKE